MSESQKAPEGPDLTQGARIAELGRDGKLLGHVGDEPVLVVQSDGDLFAVGALCTHYHGPLAEGLVVDGTVRCPWHHACFSVRTGEALRAPAFDSLACWRVERVGDRVVVKEKLAPVGPRVWADGRPAPPSSVVIVGAGAAGFAAADSLRREGYDGPITMISADSRAPYDRPNLSKDYLAGKAPEDWLPLRDAEYYDSQSIALKLNTRVARFDVSASQVVLEDGSSSSYGALLLAMGAEPVELNVPGAPGRVHYLRSASDSRAIISALESNRHAVVVGASFIGLEVAASLRMRGINVHVVAPEPRPMEKIMGPDAGDFIRALHESHGVIFHLGETVTSIDETTATLSSGAVLDADLIVAGIGVRPALSGIEGTGIAVDRGVNVNEYLETSVPGVFAAGDIARWPDSGSGDRIRVEHWVVAERQGQVAGRNMLGARERFNAVPFFWSQHYDVTINYVGHAERWDAVELDGRLGDHDCTLTFRRGGRTLAIATIGRDLESLRGELSLEAGGRPARTRPEWRIP